MDTVLSPNTPQIESQTAKPAIKRRSRAIQDEDVQFIADQVARGLTETHAVDLLGKFNYRKWVHYKEKPARSRKVADLIKRMMAGRMSNLVGEIETAASGGTDKCGRPVRHDWRAAQMLAGLHDDRFRSQRDTTSTTTNTTQVVMLAGGEDQLRKLVGMWSNEAKLLPAGEEQAKLPEPIQGQDKPIDV